jgi:hypothetical protein
MRRLFWKAFIKSYLRLIYFDILMLGKNSAALKDKVDLWPLSDRTMSSEEIDRISYAMDMACIWYRKEVLCLMRAAATTSVLRDYGEKVEMVIGTQVFPPRTHAWVEKDGRVVNDKPYMREKYLVMERITGGAPPNTQEN